MFSTKCHFSLFEYSDMWSPEGLQGLLDVFFLRRRCFFHFEVGKLIALFTINYNLVLLLGNVGVSCEKTKCKGEGHDCTESCLSESEGNVTRWLTVSSAYKS